MGKKGYMLQTGQTYIENGEYGIYPVDGFYQFGISKSYDVKTTGQYAGTTDITLNAKTDQHTNNVVVDKRTGLMWSRAVSGTVGSGSNGKLFWDDRVITLNYTGLAGGNFAGNDIVTSSPGGYVGIIRYCDPDTTRVFIFNTDGTYTQWDGETSFSCGGVSANVASATEEGVEDIWGFLNEANAAQLAGHSDWRIPSIHELSSLLDISGSDSYPDTTIFNSFSGWIYSSCTRNTDPTSTTTLLTAFALDCSDGSVSFTGTKKPVHEHFALLVRGPLKGGWPCLVRKSTPWKVGETNGLRMCETFPDDGYVRSGFIPEMELKETGQYEGSVTISVSGKDTPFYNAVVVDHATGLMWTADNTQRGGGTLGPSSDGKLYWLDDSGLKEDIWEFLYQANRMQVGGHNDWRIPNTMEAAQLWEIETGYVPDAEFYYQGGAFWTSSTQPDDDTKAYRSVGGDNSPQAKISVTSYVRLVRGGKKDADL